MDLVMNQLPNVLRILLLIATTGSFVPQIRRIALRKDCNSISAVYIFINLLQATEQFNTGIYAIVGTVVESASTLAIWLDFSQFAAIWIGHIILFIQILSFPPSRPKAKPTLFILYAAFLLLCILPVYFIATRPKDARWWIAPTFFILHQWYIHPIITILSIFAPLFQVRELYVKRTEGALCSFGLGLQVIVFFVLAVSWPYRMIRILPVWKDFFTLWTTLGSPFADNLIFAVGQGVVWLATKRLRRPERRTETTPLLGNPR